MIFSLGNIPDDDKLHDHKETKWAARVDFATAQFALQIGKSSKRVVSEISPNFRVPFFENENQKFKKFEMTVSPTSEVW